MPRLPRTPSSTGMYHIMVRGINKKDIFKTSSEKQKYLDIVKRMNSEEEYTLYGYCIMNNHVHLLIKEENDTIDRIMKRIGVSYVYYYNKKYERIGPLFQGRFRSEKIETEDYLLSCLRYIHNNPVKAKLTSNPKAYKWSSYNSYIKEYSDENDIISRGFILDIYSKNKSNAIKELIRFTNGKNHEEFIDIEDDEIPTKTAEEIIERIQESYNINIEKIGKIKDKDLRNKYISEIRSETNYSLSEIANMTGLSKATIGRIK